LLSLFVVTPSGDSIVNVFPLTLFTSTAEQDDYPLAVLAEINPVARAEVESVFEDARANSLHARKVGLRETRHNYSHLGSRWRIQVVEPFRIWAMATQIQYSSSVNSTIYVTILKCGHGAWQRLRP
jgi:hypothetical protein